MWLSELIWRDFYVHILHHNPRVVNGAFKPEYDAIRWRNDPERFGVVRRRRIPDCGRRDASAQPYRLHAQPAAHGSCEFLTKDLLIDWRWGERYFAEKLNDFDLSANNGWQWAASTGVMRSRTFAFLIRSIKAKNSIEGTFIRKYVPELAKALQQRYTRTVAHQTR